MPDVREVAFRSEGEVCRGRLWLPDGYEIGARVPGIVLANAITAVEGLIVPGWARRLANAGYAALTFDYRRFGASDGSPRQHFEPNAQIQDVRNALTWLAAQPEIDAARLGGWGVSMGGGHMLHLAAFERRLSAVAVVATAVRAWPVYEAMMGTAGLQQMLADLGRDRAERFWTDAQATLRPAWGRPGDDCLLPVEEAYEYYMPGGQPAIAAFDNRLTVASVENMIAYDPAAALELASPTAVLAVHAEHDVIPVAAVQEAMLRAKEPKKLVVLPCRHSDLYDREPWVSRAAEEVVAWFRAHLPPRAPSITLIPEDMSPRPLHGKGSASRGS